MFLELIALLKEKLECGPCAEVIVQVDDPALLAANEGQEDPVKLKTFLKGKIKEFTIVADKFNCRYYQYTIEYDDEQLAEDVTGIDECQVVKICCADCLIDYVDEQFIDEATIASIIDNGDNTFTFDNGLGDTTTIDFAHTLSEPVDGTVRLTRPDGSFDEVDVSSTVNLPLLGSGTAADPLDVLISADADNILVLGTDSGLYVPEPPAVPGETITTLVDNGDNTFTYTSEDATVTTFDVAHTLQAGATGVVRLVRPDGTFDNVNITVNTTLPIQNTGAPGDPLDLLISADGGNVITLGTDNGIYAGTTVTVITSLPITGDGSGGSPIDLLLSTDAGNNIILGTDSGIYANVPVTQLAIQGDGSVGSPIEIFFSTDAGNQAIIGTDNGLFVPEPAVDTTLPITGDGTAGNPVELLLSIDGGNIATLGSDNGLYVPAAGSTVTTALPITGDGSGGNPVDLLFSTDANNQATTGTDGGLFVAIEQVVTALPITGNGTAGSPIDLLISTDANNQLTTGTDGGAFVAIEQIVTALPITGNGTAGSPVDLLFSVDAGNIATTGGNGGLHVPDTAPNPDSIILRQTPAESGTLGSGTSFGVRVQSMGPAANVACIVMFQVPMSWDGVTNPILRARLINNNAADGNIRFEYNIRSRSLGDVINNVSDQLITFTHVVASGADVLYTLANQAITAGLVTAGDWLAVQLTRLGTDALDTQTGNANLYEISIEFARTSFGVTN